MEDTFDTSIFIVTDDKTVILSGEYDETDDGAGRFVMVTNDELNPEFGNDNTIYVSRNWFNYLSGDNLDKSVFSMCHLKHRDKCNPFGKDTKCYRNFIWQADDSEIEGSRYCDVQESDFDGRLNCNNILSHARKMLTRHNEVNAKQGLYNDEWWQVGILEHVHQMFPAVFAAYTSTEQLCGQTVNGYIPSISQMWVLYLNSRGINDILVGNLHSRQFDLNLESYWTSSAYWTAEQWAYEDGFNFTPVGSQHRIFVISDVKI